MTATLVLFQSVFNFTFKHFQISFLLRHNWQTGRPDSISLWINKNGLRWLTFTVCTERSNNVRAGALCPQARGEVPRLPNGLPEKSSRPDRPRARDRPKPRRRPRPKEPGETTRRSRSAPAQSSPAVPQPPTHTAHHEGFLFRKLDIESTKKSTNRWVFRAVQVERRVSKWKKSELWNKTKAHELVKVWYLRKLLGVYHF